MSEEKEVTCSTDQIWEMYQTEYHKFAKCYMALKNRGYEIFINDHIAKELLPTFWRMARCFKDERFFLDDLEQIAKFKKANDDLTDSMEEMFGLTNR